MPKISPSEWNRKFPQSFRNFSPKGGNSKRYYPNLETFHRKFQCRFISLPGVSFKWVASVTQELRNFRKLFKENIRSMGLPIKLSSSVHTSRSVFFQRMEIVQYVAAIALFKQRETKVTSCGQSQLRQRTTEPIKTQSKTSNQCMQSAGK